MSGGFIMDVAYMRFSTGDRTFFIAVFSAMSDLTLTNGECEDLRGPKQLTVHNQVLHYVSLELFFASGKL